MGAHWWKRGEDTDRLQAETNLKRTMKATIVLLLMLVLSSTSVRAEGRDYNNYLMKKMTRMYLGKRDGPYGPWGTFGERWSALNLVEPSINNQAYRGGYGNRPDADA
uniref:Uncharacterized protein n=1 Tax=Plectus sambesii TaxID=2011161 RepID=A0A914WSN2_9BILA